MIEDSDNAAASELWNAVGAAAGIAAADVALGLRHTVPGQDGWWGLTATTVTDQLRLLSDLSSSRSPLSARSRSYELGLMRNVEAGQDWGCHRGRRPGHQAGRQERVDARQLGWPVGEQQHRRGRPRR